VAEPAQKSRARKLALGAFGLAVTLVALLPMSAQAQVPADLIAPEDADQTIQVWIRLDADKSPLPGIGVNVEGEGIDEDVVTGADGKVLIGLEEPGDYTITIDESTLPPEAGFPNKNPREISVSSGQKGAPGIFLVSPENQEMGATPAPNAGSGKSSGPGFWTLFWPKVVTGLIFGLLLALAAIGLSLIYGTTGLNNFAHGELVTFGALAGYVVAGPLHLPGWFGIIVALVLGGAFGYVQDLGLWKPLRKKGVGLIPLMIVSIGLSLALRYIFQFIFGPDLLITPNNQSSILNLGPIHLRSTDISSPIICIIVLLLVAFGLLRTRIGKATRAVADNRSLAAATGINVERVIRIVWVVGGALAGLSGALIGYYQPVSWQTGASILLLIFASVTLGGLGTAFGALVGSLVIGLIVDLSQAVGVPSNMKFVAALLVMIIILIFRPQGILGRKDRIG